MQQLTRVEEGKTQSNKVTLASPIQNLWFILFDRSSGRQIPLIVSLVRNSEDDSIYGNSEKNQCKFLERKFLLNSESGNLNHFSFVVLGFKLRNFCELFAFIFDSAVSDTIREINNRTDDQPDARSEPCHNR